MTPRDPHLQTPLGQQACSPHPSFNWRAVWVSLSYLPRGNRKSSSSPVGAEAGSLQPPLLEWGPSHLSLPKKRRRVGPGQDRTDQQGNLEAGGRGDDREALTGDRWGPNPPARPRLPRTKSLEPESLGGEDCDRSAVAGPRVTSTLALNINA